MTYILPDGQNKWTPLKYIEQQKKNEKKREQREERRDLCWPFTFVRRKRNRVLEHIFLTHVAFQLKKKTQSDIHRQIPYKYTVHAMQTFWRVQHLFLFRSGDFSGCNFILKEVNG